MKLHMSLLAVALLPLGGLFAMSDSHAADLMVGDDAPLFEMVGSDGTTYRSEDFKGKQALVLAWFPKAFTGG